MASNTRLLERTLRLKVNQAKSTVARNGERTFLRYRIHGQAQERLGIAPKGVKRRMTPSIRRLRRGRLPGADPHARWCERRGR